MTSLKAYLRLVLLGAAIGIPAALIAYVFLAIVHELQHWFWDELPHLIGLSVAPWYLIIGLPLIGAAITAVARKYLPGDGGPSPLEHFGVGGKLLPSHVWGIMLAAIGTLVFGIVLGPEATLIALGGVVGAAVLKFVKLNTDESKVLSSAGSFAAISSILGGPLVAGIFMMEGALGMGTTLMPVLLPGFVASAVGYVVIVALSGSTGISGTGLVVPDLPLYHGPYFLDLCLAIALGIVAAVIISWIKRVAQRVSYSGIKKLGMPKLLLLGGFLVGVVALIAVSLGADLHDVFFSGQNSLPALAIQSSLWIMLVLLIAKSIVFAVSLGSGFRGGPVFPVIFIGISLAMILSIALGISPTWAVAVGAAAGMASMTRMLLTPMLFAALLVGTAGFNVVPAAVLAACAAWFTLVIFERREVKSTGEVRTATKSE